MHADLPQIWYFEDFANWGPTHTYILFLHAILASNAVIQIGTLGKIFCLLSGLFLLYIVVQFFVEICGFAICGLIMKICRFSICGLAHIGNLQICVTGMSLRIYEFADFRIGDILKKLLVLSTSVIYTFQSQNCTVLYSLLIMLGKF